MAITTQNNRNDYIADGSQTQYNYTFKIFVPSDLSVYLDDSLQTGGYTVTGAGNDAGGAVIFSTAPSAGTRVTLLRTVPYTQQLVFVDNDPLPAKSLNDGFDKATILTQQLLEKLGRALTLKPTSIQSNKTIDDLVPGKLLRVKPDASGIEMTDIYGSGTIQVPVVPAEGGTGANNSGASEGEVLVANSFGNFVRSVDLFLADAGRLGWTNEFFRRLGAGQVEVRLGGTGRIRFDTNNGAGRIVLTNDAGTAVLTIADTAAAIRLDGQAAKPVVVTADANTHWELASTHAEARLGGNGRVRLDTNNGVGRLALANDAGTQSFVLSDLGTLVRMAATSGKALRLAANGTDYWEIGTNGALTPLNSAPTSLGLRSVSVFTSSGTWNRPGSVRKVFIRMVGGGGGGGGAGAGTSGGGGGGAGAYLEALVDVQGLTSLSITVGGGGGGGPDGNPGGAGGTTSVTGTGVSLSCPGGGGGSVETGTGNLRAAPGAGAAPGSASGSAVLYHVTVGGSPGLPWISAGGFTACLPAGAASLLGRSVVKTTSGGSGPAGGPYGSGGGGAWSESAGASFSGGAGSGGVVIIEEYE